MTRRAGYTVVEMLLAVALMGVALAAVLTVVVGSSRQIDSQTALARQGSELRAAIAVIRRDLSAAQIPMTVQGPAADGCPARADLCIDWANNTSTTPGQLPRARGDQIVFYRPEYPGAAANPTCVGERIGWAAAGAVIGGVTLPTASVYMQQASSTLGPPAVSQILAAAPKILVSNALPPSSNKPLFSYSADGASPALPTGSTDTSWKHQVKLIDISLSKDEDGAGSDLIVAQSVMSAAAIGRAQRSLRGVSTNPCGPTSGW